MTHRIDWFRVLAELQTYAGMTKAQVARALGLGESTVRGWYSEIGCEPSYEKGEALIDLWAKVCDKPRDKVPRHARLPSVSQSMRANDRISR